ncbi:MAG TPA: efflux RND transporter periplasmic adaptor subunit [Polyangiales bacterium]|nr:efflux RND transporter periplasmic adaptor subunit [Polyangiales bacterium]
MNDSFSSLARMCQGLIVLAATVSGCAPEPARAGPGVQPRAVRVVRAERTESQVVTEVVGSVRAVRSSSIASLISGTVVEVRVGLGSSVRSGEVLVRVSAREIDARVEQARAMAALADPERDRAVHLRNEGAISTAQYDAAVTQWNIAQARQAEANAIAEHATIRAPFAGVITGKLANAGDTAMPGQPLLTLEAPGAFRFEARVPETLAARALSIGKPVSIRLDGREDAIHGTVAEIQPASDEATRTRLAKIDLPRTPGLRSGWFGRLLLATGASSAVSVPARAVIRQGQLEGVFVVDAGTARLRLVRSTRERDGRLEIASGLAGDESIVLATADLIDGQAVEVVP